MKFLEALGHEDADSGTGRAGRSFEHERNEKSQTARRVRRPASRQLRQYAAPKLPPGGRVRRDFPAAIEDCDAEGEDSVGEIDAVGDAISSKVVEYVETGEIEELTELRDELPVEMDALTAVEGVRADIVGSLYERWVSPPG